MAMIVHCPHTYLPFMQLATSCLLLLLFLPQRRALLGNKLFLSPLIPGRTTCHCLISPCWAYYYYYLLQSLSSSRLLFVMRNRKSPPGNTDASSSSSQAAHITSSASSSFSPLLPSNMQRAICYGAHYEKPVVEKTQPIPKKCRRGYLLVEVKAVGLNPVDAKQVVGDKLPYSWTTLRSLAHKLLVQNTRVGFDFAGKVVKGSSSSSIHIDELYPPGTNVWGTMPPLQGSCSRVIEVPIDQVSKMPSNLSFEQAAALPLVGLTALQSLSPHILQGKSSVLVVGGSGGTGHVALQVAKNLGARHVTTICSTRNVDFVTECGATHVVDYTKGDLVQQLRQAPGVPFDLILDCVTSADPSDASLQYPQLIRNPANDLVTSKHLYQRLGGPCGDWIRASLARPNIFPHWLVWQDTMERLFWIRFPKSSGELESLREFVEAGHLKPQIAKVIPHLTAAGVQEGFDDILQRRVQGKIVVRFQQENDDVND
jgi:NADPH:quinone reductase-like Zn-dependent oxidoreductase